MSDNDKKGNKSSPDETIPETENTEMPKGAAGSVKSKPSKPPVTIDLKSDQVKSKSGSASDSKNESAGTGSKSSSAEDKSPSQAGDGNAAKTGSTDSFTAKQSQSGKTSTNDSLAEQSAESDSIGGQNERSKSNSDTQNDMTAATENSPKQGGRIISNILSGVVGGLLVLIIMYVFSLFEPNTTDPTVRIETIEAVNREDDGRLTALESQTSVIGARLNDFFNESNEDSELVKLSNALGIHEEQLNEFGEQMEAALFKLNSLDGSESIDSGIVEELKRSLTQIEEKIDEDRAKVESLETIVSDQQTSVGQLTSQGEALRKRLTAVQQLLDSFATISTDLADAQSKITDLTARMGNFETAVEQSSPRELASQTIAFVALKSAIDRGEPFAIELDAVRSIFPESEALAKFAEQSEFGIATAPELISIFPDIARKMDAENQKSDEDSGVFDALVSGFRSLVVIRNTEVDESSDVSSLIFAMKNSVEIADFERALEIYEFLPQNIRKPAGEWVDSVMIRLEVDSLMHKVTADVIESMSDSMK